MTPPERAEKILDRCLVDINLDKDIPELQEFLAAQIEEATDDAWKIGRHKGFAEGFRAAREKAKGIA